MMFCDYKNKVEYKEIMKSKLIFLFVLICVSVWLNSVTWHIKQDGTGNFTTIQEGIDASTDSDNVLVYPGTYYENINYIGKNITVASLELTTGDEQYIYSTIIDGQRLSSCVSIVTGETDTCLRGLTITNGQGADDDPLFGGGISIFGDDFYLVQCDIINCIITKNYGRNTGGIIIEDGEVYLSGTSIRQNEALRTGGGIGIGDCSQVVFDPVNRCSIYDNVAATGVEMYIRSLENNEQTVILDTFTVAEPTRYFAQVYPGDYNVVYNFDILNHTLEPIDHDLYVSTEGNDNNSGLSADDPLKTINLAVRNIASNSDDPHTIHLAAGTYSKSLNQQHFAFGCKKYVNIIGENMDTTIIDGEMGNYPLFYTGSDYNYSVLKNLTFQNGMYFSSIISIYYSDFIQFVNIVVQNCVLDRGGAILGATSSGNVELINVTVDNIEAQDSPTAGVMFNGTTSFKASNCTFSNNTSTGSTAFSAGLYAMSSGDITIENCKFFGNTATGTVWQGYASALLLTDYNHEMGNVNINNCLFYDNTVNNGESAIFAKSLVNGNVHFTNNTVVDNQAPYGIEFKGNIDFKNNILRNDSYYEILLNIIDPGVYSTIDVSYSNIDGGVNAIHNGYGMNTINWLEGNIDADPLFLLSGDDPYQLTELSPCIDTGTPDTTGFFIHPWDLLNNHRVWDGDGDGIAIIDMGCYEYAAEPYVGIINEQLPMTDYQLTNYPNPFNPETKIVLHLPEPGQVKLEIYNIIGQKVKTLLDCYMDSGRSETLWNSKDENSKRVSSGVYFYKLDVNGKTEKIKKMLLLK